MKKLLFLLLMGIVAATGFSQIADASFYQRKQLGPGANWLFDYDTVRINRLMVERAFCIDSLGRIVFNNNAVPAAGSLLKGTGAYYDNFAKGTANQLLRVNAGATDIEWFTPTYGTGTVTSIGTTSPITGGTITTTGTIGISQAATATDGYLSSTDWNTFNKKSGLVLAPLGLTGQTGPIAASTVYTTPAADGWYRVSITGTITTAAGTSLDFATQIRWTEATDNVVKTFPTSNINNFNRTQTNTTGAAISITALCHVKASTNIQYISAFTFSGGAPQYDLMITVEKLDY